MVTSKEHEDSIKFISKKLNLKIKKVSLKGYWFNTTGRIKRDISGYFPDLIDNKTDYELEIVPKASYLNNKVVKWDKKRKKVLILKVNSFAFKHFNKIFVVKGKKLIKIK